MKSECSYTIYSEDCIEEHKKEVLGTFQKKFKKKRDFLSFVTIKKVLKSI